MVNLKIVFADICLNLQCDFEPKLIDKFQNFVSSFEENDMFDYQIKISKKSNIEFQNFDWSFINGHQKFKILDDGRVLKQFYNIYKNQYYALAIDDLTNRTEEIYYLPQDSKYFKDLGNCFYHVSWETMMLLKNRLILHSCCVNTIYGGILFSGPSGIGKSTQGNLWIENEDAQLINGDRPILYKNNDIWKAYGSPYAGSSEVHINKYCNIRCIVMLQQDLQNSIRKLNALEAFQKVLAQLTVSSWDKRCVERLVDCLQVLITDIPVYELKCTPDIHAIDCLKSVLVEDKNLG